MEEIVQKRFESFENGQTLTDLKNKTLSLKVRSQPTQGRYYSGDNSYEA